MPAAPPSQPEIIAHLESITCCPIEAIAFVNRSFLIFHTEHGDWILSRKNDADWWTWAMTTCILFAKNQSA